MEEGTEDRQIPHNREAAARVAGGVLKQAGNRETLAAAQLDGRVSASDG